ncbi:MAG: hypothetical protein ABMA13_23805 [Chthoniobacteraceae bacterium]
MNRIALCLLAFAVSASAAPWEFATRKQGRRVAFVALRGTGPGGACDATLVFSRLAEAGRKPVTKDDATTPPLVIELWLTNAKQATPFKLTDFEGPDATDGIATMVLTAKEKPKTSKWPTSGWFSPLRDPTGGSDKHRDAGEAEVFVFGLGDSFAGYRDLLALADALAAGADAFTIDIAGRAKGAPRLRFDVPLAGASDALKQLLAPRK